MAGEAALHFRSREPLALAAVLARAGRGSGADGGRCARGGGAGRGALRLGAGRRALRRRSLAGVAARRSCCDGRRRAPTSDAVRRGATKILAGTPVMLKQQPRLLATFVFLADLCLVAARRSSPLTSPARARAALGLGSPAPELHPLGDYLPLLPLVLAIWTRPGLVREAPTPRTARCRCLREAVEIVRVLDPRRRRRSRSPSGLPARRAAAAAPTASAAPGSLLFAVLAVLFLVAEKLGAARSPRARSASSGLNYRTVLDRRHQRRGRARSPTRSRSTATGATA